MNLGTGLEIFEASQNKWPALTGNKRPAPESTLCTYSSKLH